MRALSFFVSVLGAAADTAQAPALIQQRSRLRGGRIVELHELEEKALGRGLHVEGQRYSDDDASCSAEGISPGVCALASLARPSSTKAFSAMGGADCNKKESRDRLERALIAEIESALAGNHTGIDEKRLRQLEEELRPIYTTLPAKDADGEEGGLGYAAAKYLLHQHFLRQHAWYVRGLNPAGDGRKPPDDKEALRSRVAGHLLEVMEGKAPNGLDLKMLAVFVATLEHLIHGDQRERLKQAWLIHGLKPDDATSPEGLVTVLEVFMAHYVYVSQKNDSGYALTSEKAAEEVKTISRIYGGWPQIQDFIQKQVAIHQKKRVSFDDAANAADAVLLVFQEVSGSMCHDMEKTVQSLPGGQEGRVKLNHLRSADGGDLFRESVEYLRELGALEGPFESELVLMPNYMLGPSNCDGTTSFYDLCCPNSCEVHKSRLERALMTDQGDPLNIITTVIRERSGFDLPEMHFQLEQLAKEHGGKILIHGQAFADLLHIVFPRECPCFFGLLKKTSVF